MLVPGSASPLLFHAPAGGAATAGRSIRLNAPDSAYLSRTPASAGNRKTFTLSLWLKRARLGTNIVTIFGAGQSGGYGDKIVFTSSDTLRFFANGGNNGDITTTQVFRDPSAWYHLVIAVDTTQATAANRIRLYLNGSEITALSATYPAQNYDFGSINTATAHEIGRGWGDTFDGYLALVHFIDGQQLTPSSFGETSATTGRWEAKTYAGTYSGNSFFLDFSDNSAATATTLGKDSSGLGNNWTPNNLSVTAGSGNDSLRDHPTSAGTSTGLGGEVSGNYCTLNPLAITNLPATPSNGNLETTGNRNSYGTIALPSSGKWYWEVTPTAGTDPMIGMAAYDSTTNSAILQTSVFYYINGNKYITGTGTAYGASYALNDVIGVAANIDAGTVTFYKNNTSQGAITFNAAGLFPASTTGGGSATYTFNFGQRAFAYTAPSGFSPLVDTLLPTPTIALPNTVMDAVTYTGTGSGNTITLPGSFNPDLIWIKRRSAASDHVLMDVVRGFGSANTKVLYSNLTNSEDTTSVIASTSSTGFTIGGSGIETNANGSTYVAWTWDAGSSNATNTSGTITSTVRANISAGFSVVTYTGTGSNATVGHGLGVAPQLIIVKRRNTTGNWATWHTGIANTQYLFLNSDAGSNSGTTYWNSTSPTSSVFSIGTASDVNANGGTYVAYCWAPVSYLSSFGTYTGNGLADGPYVHCGFRPKFLIQKRFSSGLGEWIIWDSSRKSYNFQGPFLMTQSSAAENADAEYVDFLSNGFKWRTTNGTLNGSGVQSLYIAFAEAPFPYARAR